MSFSFVLYVKKQESNPVRKAGKCKNQCRIRNKIHDFSFRLCWQILRTCSAFFVCFQFCFASWKYLTFNKQDFSECRTNSKVKFNEQQSNSTKVNKLQTNSNNLEDSFLMQAWGSPTWHLLVCPLALSSTFHPAHLPHTYPVMPDTRERPSRKQA